MSDKKPVDDLFDTPPELRERLVKTGEIPDSALLAEHMRHLQREVRDGFELWANKILPELGRIREAIGDMSVRLTRVEKDALSTDKRLTAIEQELGLAKKSQARKRK